MYFVFLFFLTGYVLVSRPYLPAYVTSNGTRVCVSKITRADKDDALVVIFMIAGRLLVIILGSFQLFLEVKLFVKSRMEKCVKNRMKEKIKNNASVIK